MSNLQQSPSPSSGSKEIPPPLTVSFCESSFQMSETDSYKVHQSLCDVMEASRTQKPYIYRVDIAGDISLVRVRASSDISLAGGVLKSYTFSQGDILSFDLRCAPVERSPDRGRKIIQIPKNEEAIPWLEKRAAYLGFEIVDIDDVSSFGLIFHGKHRRRITLNETYFTGQLKVTDPAVFAETMVKGIGRAKGFGFGLLVLN